MTRTSPPRGFCFRPKICTNCPETVASGNAGAEAIGSSRPPNTALRMLVVPELKLFRPHREPITQLSCRRRCDRRTAFWRRASLGTELIVRASARLCSVFAVGGRGSGPSNYSGGVNHSDLAPIEGLCSAIGLHLLIEPVTRPLASWNVVTRCYRCAPCRKVVPPLASVRPVTRPASGASDDAAVRVMTPRASGYRHGR